MLDSASDGPSGPAPMVGLFFASKAHVATHQQLVATHQQLALAEALTKGWGASSKKLAWMHLGPSV